MNFKCPNCGSIKLWMLDGPETIILQSEKTELHNGDFFWCEDCLEDYEVTDVLIQEQIVDGRMPV